MDSDIATHVASRGYVKNSSYYITDKYQGKTCAHFYTQKGDYIVSIVYEETQHQSSSEQSNESKLDQIPKGHDQVSGKTYVTVRIISRRPHPTLEQRMEGELDPETKGSAQVRRIVLSHVKDPGLSLGGLLKNPVETKCPCRIWCMDKNQNAIDSVIYEGGTKTKEEILELFKDSTCVDLQYMRTHDIQIILPRKSQQASCCIL